MSKLYRALLLISYLGMLNFLAFIVIALFLGGDGLNGKVEAGHYYLGNHGFYTEMPGVIYWYSRVHGISVFVSWPFMMIAGFIASIEEQYGGEIIYLGKIYGLVEELFWRLFDSWRKPASEFFTKVPGEEWNGVLETVLQQYNAEKPHRRQINVYTGGNHFNVSGMRSLIEVHGRVTSTAHGVYVRIWHRFTLFGLMFLTVLVGGFITRLLLILPIWLLVALVLQSDMATAFEAIHPFNEVWIISAASIVSAILYLSWLGSQIGQRMNRDIAYLIKDALRNAYDEAHRVSSIYRR